MSTTERIIAELRERHEKGLAKYGVTVDRTDLSPAQWGQHLKEELLDGAEYAQRLIDTMKEEEERIKALEVFAASCANNWDCDEDGHRYGTECRACEARLLIGTKESKP